MPEVPLWVVVTHFLNLSLLTRLARSGIEVLSAITMVKWIRAIELVESYAQIGMGQGGWREDQQYHANAAGI